MNILAFAGIRAEAPAAVVDDSPLIRLVDTAKAAHDHLRAHLKDPDFAGVLCRALGCRQGGCLEAAPTLKARSKQIPAVVDKLKSGG